jgi:hypothetical protein
VISQRAAQLGDVRRYGEARYGGSTNSRYQSHTRPACSAGVVANFLFGDVGGGKHFQSAIQLVNLGETPTEATIECFSNDGAPTPPFASTPYSVTLPPNQVIELYTLYTPGSDQFKECWCRIGKNPDNKIELSSRILLWEPSTAVPYPLTSALTASVRIPASRQAPQWKVPVSLLHVLHHVLSASALSIVNPSDSTAQVELVLDWRLTATVGTEYGPLHLTIPPQGRIARNLLELFPEIAPKPELYGLPSLAGGQGVVTVGANSPVVVTGLEVSSPTIVYTSMLAIPVS